MDNGVLPRLAEAERNCFLLARTIIQSVLYHIPTYCDKLILVI